MTPENFNKLTPFEQAIILLLEQIAKSIKSLEAENDSYKGD